MSLKEIFKPIENELEKFDTFFKSQMSSDVALLDIIISYLTRKKGKRLRPAITLLTAKICGGINDRTYSGAAMLVLSLLFLYHSSLYNLLPEFRIILQNLLPALPRNLNRLLLLHHQILRNQD